MKPWRIKLGNGDCNSNPAACCVGQIGRPRNRPSNFVSHGPSGHAELKYHEALAPIRPVFRTAMADSPPAITVAHINRFRQRARFHFGVSYAILFGILILLALPSTFSCSPSK